MNDSGYIALHRKIRSNFLWSKARVFSQAEAWIDLLMEARPFEEPAEVMIGMTVLECRYGQTIRSQVSWAERWEWSRGRVSRFLKVLEERGMIRTEIEQQTSRITICNYIKYDIKRAGSGASNGHQTDTERTHIRTKEHKELKNKDNNTLVLTPPEKASKKYTAGFEQFWAAWPKHERKAGKAKCMGIWKRKKCEAITQQIVCAVEAYKTSRTWTEDGGKYIPMPENWLNKGLWDCDLDSLKQGKKYDNRQATSRNSTAVPRPSVGNPDGAPTIDL